MPDMNNILEPFDNLLKSIDKNKNLLILLLILLGIYFTYYNNNLVKNYIYLFDNEIFKFIMFIIITYASSSSPAIGIALALIMFVSLQIITYIKLKKELDDDIDSILEDSDEVNKEKFSSMEPVDNLYLDDDYLSNPYKKINELAPPINFNLELTSPKELSYQMINKGKSLLNDSYDLEQDILSRYDSREKQIAFETKRNGNELLKSGINRLQMANQGEYTNKSINLDKELNKTKKNNTYNKKYITKNNTINKKNIISKNDKFIKYDELIKKTNKNKSLDLLNLSDISVSLLSACYNELIYNYNLLTKKQLNNKAFDLQLNKVYKSELDLLEIIYKINKSTYSNDKQKIINEMILYIKNLSSEEKINLSNKLEQLYLLMI